MKNLIYCLMYISYDNFSVKIDKFMVIMYNVLKLLINWFCNSIKKIIRFI